MSFLSELISKKLLVTTAAEAWIQTLHMNADAKGQCTAAIALVYVIAQAWVDSHQARAQVPNG